MATRAVVSGTAFMRLLGLLIIPLISIGADVACSASIAANTVGMQSIDVHFCRSDVATTATHSGIERNVVARHGTERPLPSSFGSVAIAARGCSRNMARRFAQYLAAGCISSAVASRTGTRSVVVKDSARKTGGALVARLARSQPHCRGDIVDGIGRMHHSRIHRANAVASSAVGRCARPRMVERCANKTGITLVASLARGQAHCRQTGMNATGCVCHARIHRSIVASTARA